VRVSTLDQNEKRQLEGRVLEWVFTDKAPGRDTARAQLTELLRFGRDGETVVVHSMDRLARNLNDLRPSSTRKGVRVEFVKEPGLHRRGLPHGQPHAFRHECIR
jgi:DNA invertase Pin-like site-specific DNA recombinase